MTGETRFPRDVGHRKEKKLKKRARRPFMMNTMIEENGTMPHAKDPSAYRVAYKNKMKRDKSTKINAFFLFSYPLCTHPGSDWLTRIDLFFSIPHSLLSTFISFTFHIQLFSDRS